MGMVFSVFVRAIERCEQTPKSSKVEYLLPMLAELSSALANGSVGSPKMKTSLSLMLLVLVNSFLWPISLKGDLNAGLATKKSFMSCMYKL